MSKVSAVSNERILVKSDALVVACVAAFLLEEPIDRVLRAALSEARDRRRIMVYENAREVWSALKSREVPDDDVRAFVAAVVTTARSAFEKGEGDNAAAIRASVENFLDRALDY